MAQIKRKRERKRKARKEKKRRTRKEPQEGDGELTIVKIKKDGNCLFRALAEQIWGNQDLHAACRHRVVEYMVRNPHEFGGFYTEKEAGSFESYCNKMSRDGEWGGHLELHAAAKVFQVNIHIRRSGDSGQRRGLGPSAIYNFNGAKALHLSYCWGNHYDSVHL